MRSTPFLAALLALFFTTAIADAQRIPTPKEHFGHNIGDDYFLADYTQAEAYLKILAESDRVQLVDIGKTEWGRTQYMMVVSSPENLSNIDRYKEISQRMGRAEGLSPEEAKSLASEGRAVVWINGGLHGTEVVATQQIVEMAYQITTRTDEETLDILDNVITLLVLANPDGMEIVSSWYMRSEDPRQRRANTPVLYQKYAGHNNNRDLYRLALAESRNMSRQLYIEWIPQIMHDHHQTGPAGTVLSGPPYREPFNYNFDPILVTSLDAIGAAMGNRLNAEGKPGYTQGDGAPFTAWWNGGMRTTPYFHNIIGILTEINGNPTPRTIPYRPERILPNGDWHNPIEPQPLPFRTAIDYSISINYSVLNYASRNRDQLLYNIYLMASNSIEKGSRDHWTRSPRLTDIMIEEHRNDRRAAGDDSRTIENISIRNVPASVFNRVFSDPELRDPRGFIIPADQADFPTAITFLNSLIGSGVIVHEATDDFTVMGKRYPRGSYVVKAAQAYRPHVIDMFEPQYHPTILQYPGGPPVRPYDQAGWTMAFQMGVEFDRILDEFSGPFTALPAGQLIAPPPGTVDEAARAGYILSPKVNNTFIVINELLSEGARVYRLNSTDSGSESEAGTFFVPSTNRSRRIVERGAENYGVEAKGVSRRPSDITRIDPARIALWDRYRGSMASGWFRYIFDQHNYPYTVVYPQELDAGDLRSKYDVIVFPAGAIPSYRSDVEEASGPPPQPRNPNIPDEYQSWLGSVSQEHTMPQIREFIEDGGIIISLQSSTSNLINHFDLPVGNALVRRDSDGNLRRIPASEYFIPGSILESAVNTESSAAWGMPPSTHISFNQGPVFSFEEGASESELEKLLWFSTDTPVKSGWEVGQEHLLDGITGFRAKIGNGELIGFGSDIIFRSQSHGNFKLIFNQLYTKQ